MARLVLVDPATFVVTDFHSHTNASWDARAGCSPAANRAWHRAAGFDAAYVGEWREDVRAPTATDTATP